MRGGRHDGGGEGEGGGQGGSAGPHTGQIPGSEGMEWNGLHLLRYGSD